MTNKFKDTPVYVVDESNHPALSFNIDKESCFKGR